jgi:ribosomal protein S18 acetylase RimI-like enzyme
MGDIVVRELAPRDYAGVRYVDELTQGQYIGATWERLPDDLKEEHLVSRTSDFAVYLETDYCFVATNESRIIGFLFAYEVLPFGGRIYITYIAVSPEYQGHEVGLLLYGELIEKAKRNGIKQITALINPDNDRSMKLHRKAGFVLQDRKEARLELK